MALKGSRKRRRNSHNYSLVYSHMVTRLLHQGKRNDSGDKGTGTQAQRSQYGEQSTQRGTRDKPGDPLSSAPAAPLTGIPVGAGQAVSGHLRGWLVTTVQELLGVEDMAGVGNAVHAVQNVDLGSKRVTGSKPPTADPIPHCLGGVQRSTKSHPHK